LRRAGGAITLPEAPDGAVLYTGGGPIRVGAAAGLVSATTGGGDITIGPAAGSVEASTGAGDVTVTVDGEGARGRVVTVTSGNGAVDLYLPADVSARLDLETAYTVTLGRRTRIESDWPVERTETDDWTAAAARRAGSSAPPRC
jgi:DUF4097 and DUF4098 domain-containing protein YvlB